MVSASSEELGEWEFFIPNYIIPSLNLLVNHHWTKLYKAKKQLVQFIRRYGSDVPKATGKRILEVEIRNKKGGRIKDEGNLEKILHDALVIERLLWDDSPDWLQRGKIIQNRFNPDVIAGTLIRLREADEEGN